MEAGVLIVGGALPLQLNNHLHALIETKVKAEITTREWAMGAVMTAWRLLLVGAPSGPALFDLAETLGKEETIKRYLPTEYLKKLKDTPFPLLFSTSNGVLLKNANI